MGQQQTNLKTYPWVPFPGAYMTAVPEVPPTSAITIANQIPPEILANIPASQQEAYIEQWPMMTAEQRLAVTQTYGTAAAPLAITSTPDSIDSQGNCLPGYVRNYDTPAGGPPCFRESTANSTPPVAMPPTQQPPTAMLDIMPNTVPPELLAAVPDVARDAFAAGWPTWTNEARQAQYGAFLGHYWTSSSPMQAGLGDSGLLWLAGAAAVAFLILRKK